MSSTEMNASHAWFNPLNVNVGLIQSIDFGQRFLEVLPFDAPQANQLAGFYMRATLAFNGLILNQKKFLICSNKYVTQFHGLAKFDNPLTP